MTDDESAPAPPVEELAGRYRLAGLLGRGGMGEVWSATDAVLGRGVAVKLLPSLSGADLERRFQREAATLARLRHPGITVVHDAGRHGGFLFLVMELLDGADLGKLLAGQPGGLPLDRALDLAAQTAEAVAAAHDDGVVHRDLKPANVFVQAGDRVKVCDFGIARAADATSALTATGLLIGTPPYMSPEQCLGREVDARSDLYSLGCALFEMLTGTPPFPPDQSVYALLHQHISEPPPRLAELRPDLPAALDTLVGALLAKEPGARPASAARVAKELAALRGGRTPASTAPVVVTPVPTVVAQPAAPVQHLAQAVRLVRLITDADARREVMLPLVAAVAATHPGQAETLAGELTADDRCFALAKVAEALNDPPRARRLLGEADALAEAIPASRPERIAAVLPLLARLWVPLDPERAFQVLERAGRCLPLIDDEVVYWHARQLAEAISRLAEFAGPDAARLMKGLERTVAAFDVDVEFPTFLAEKLAGIAVAGRAADPEAAERMLARAEWIAEHDDDSSAALEYLAGTVAEADLPRARLILGRITDDFYHVATWAKIIEAVGTHQRELLDGLLRSSGFDGTPAPAGAGSPSTTGAQDMSRYTGFALKYVTEAAAPFVPGWAVRVASRIDDANYLNEAFVRMAAVVAEDQPALAEQWLRHAFQLALDAAKAASARPVPALMGAIAEEATTIAPEIARAAARYVTALDDETLRNESTFRLALMASQIAVADPRGALRLVALAEARHDEPEDGVLGLIAGAQIGAAATLARSDLGLAEDTIMRAARNISAMTDMQRVSWLDWEPLGRLAAKRHDTAVQLGRRAVDLVQGEIRDHVLSGLAAAFAPVDLTYAEELVRAVTDPSVRDEALAGIAEELVAPSA